MVSKESKERYRHVETGEEYELTEKEYYLFPKNVLLVKIVEEKKTSKKVKE